MHGTGGQMSLRKRRRPEEEGGTRLPWLRGASPFRDGEEKGFCSPQCELSCGN